jgi:hypothetical protein
MERLDRFWYQSSAYIYQEVTTVIHRTHLLSFDKLVANKLVNGRDELVERQDHRSPTSATPSTHLRKNPMPAKEVQAAQKKYVSIAAEGNGLRLHFRKGGSSLAREKSD